MSNEKESLTKASILYIIGTIIGQGMTFLGTAVFTRLMTKYDFGVYSTYYSVMSIVVVFVGCNLYVPLQNAYIDFKEEIHEYRKSVLALSSVICIVTGLVTVIINLLFIKAIPVYMTICSIIHGYGFFLVNYRMNSDNMEFNYRNKMFMLIVPTTLQLLLSWGAVLLFNSNMLIARIIASTIGVGICGTIGFVSIIRYKGQLYNKIYWQYSLKIAVPSIMMSVSYMLMQQCDKVVITALVGAEETAEYSVIYYLGYGINAVSGAVSAVFSAWLYKAISEKRESEVSSTQKVYLIFMAFVECAVLMVGPEVVKVISTEEYWNFEFVAPFVLGAGMMTAYGLYTNVGLYYKKSGMISVCVMISAAVNLALNFIFIPRWGAIAACYTTVIAYILLFVTTKLLADKCNRNLYSQKQMHAFISYSVLACLVFDYLYQYFVLRYVFFGMLVIGFVVYIWSHKEDFLYSLR